METTTRAILISAGSLWLLSFAPFCMNDGASFMDFSYSGINTETVDCFNLSDAICRSCSLLQRSFSCGWVYSARRKPVSVRRVEMGGCGWRTAVSVSVIKGTKRAK
uniref:Secreted protein n=1 Tax=Tetraodon nigroviridis TaxID=99883 RepID=H3BYK3_TETNG